MDWRSAMQDTCGLGFSPAWKGFRSNTSEWRQTLSDFHETLPGGFMPMMFDNMYHARQFVSKGAGALVQVPRCRAQNLHNITKMGNESKTTSADNDTIRCAS